MPAGINLGLARITRLLTLLHSPHLATPVVHIAGTNGKGSVSAYLSSILSHSRLAVGRFNSPHLVDEWDCIQLHGRAVDPSLFREVKREVEHVSQREGVEATSFEVLTATAYALFARAKPPLDVAVVEVGMGGAEDATNVVPADRTLLSVVTSVELDHQKFLGDTVAEIAQVKAGIAREGGDVVLSVQAHPEATEAVKAVAAARGATIWQAGKASPLPDTDDAPNALGLPPSPLVSLPLAPTAVHPPTASASLPKSGSPSITSHLPLPGSYQLSNAATAVLAAHLVRSLPRPRAILPPHAPAQLSDAAIRAGVGATRWPGRLSWLSLPSPLPPSSSPSPSTAASSASPAKERLVLLDGAHNPSSAALLASYLSSLTRTPQPLRPRALLFALSAPREPAEVVRPLLRALAQPEERLRVVCVGFSPPEGMEWVRATEPEELARGVREVVDADAAQRLGSEVEVLQAANIEAGLRRLEELEGAEGKEGSDPVVVAGSLYLVADVLRLQRRLGGAADL
ncbi:hypothetical protein Rhopal_006795-T1 [Rhodotorula paludigena]|uniref:Uncharacterized protein n=1 Tax=Rhodotorula paludigena TaxID=86838 RepID=A0AAV5GU37_9BASI|nr:hypothetical protein Rhopal_006795-T1 [Rhodotorula paludigena]